MKSPILYRLALVATLFAGVVVILGAWTRLVDAGLGCPDWPGCYGFLTVPQTAEDIAVAEARFPETPVESHKGWPEMIHRYFASSLGLLMIGLCVLAVRSHQRGEKPPLWHCFGLLGLVILQGMFGMWTVTLKLWPQVVSAHLLGGFATLSLLFLLVLRTRPDPPPVPLASNAEVQGLARFTSVGIFLLVLQIFLGAWTAANYAALACGTEFPGCQGSYWPEMNFSGGFDFFQTIGPNYLGGLFDNESRVAIHYMHRVGALVVTIYLLGLLHFYRRNAVTRSMGFARAFVLAALLVQVLLGVSNVLWLTPLPVAVGHNAFGAVLLLAMINMRYQLSRVQQQ